MEILDLYDDNCKPLNETIIRGNTPEIGKNIMVSVVFIKSDDNYLIQETSKSKGNKFASTGGHVKHGENGEMCILRELKEELGITVEKKDLKHVNTFKFPNKQCIFNVFILNSNIDLSTIKLQTEEVLSVTWKSKQEIQKLISLNLFLESHGYIFNNYIFK